ncbi:hypothetical protein F0562_005418 [Nyssa sinensis]|uniref:Pentatricopeptide repeat-containing protein n=1 Tax=Nyssa sinensis TaxID=561372 RepID=A0A5J5AKA3_9ASTE|nr:hypothetical protein F0562_005418 [Nyssa sinensis]
MVYQEDVEEARKLSWVPGPAVKFFRWLGFQLNDKHNPYSWNLVVDLLGAVLLEGWGNEGDVGSARQVFAEMVIEIGWDLANVPAYNSSLTTWLKGPDGTCEAMKFFDTMKDSRCYRGLKFFKVELEDPVNTLKKGDASCTRLKRSLSNAGKAFVCVELLRNWETHEQNNEYLRSIPREGWSDGIKKLKKIWQRKLEKAVFN